eukprot:c13892_g1_i2.p1 GENE.c13892_g1_i2~~c13892_g1_i2.p1  ORF type:complete len:545 (+),score=101.03 c13892_g1_i2:278-1912(+)
MQEDQDSDQQGIQLWDDSEWPETVPTQPPPAIQSFENSLPPRVVPYLRKALATKKLAHDHLTPQLQAEFLAAQPDHAITALLAFLRTVPYVRFGLIDSERFLMNVLRMARFMTAPIGPSCVFYVQGACRFSAQMCKFSHWTNPDAPSQMAACHTCRRLPCVCDEELKERCAFVLKSQQRPISVSELLAMILRDYKGKELSGQTLLKVLREFPLFSIVQESPDCLLTLNISTIARVRDLTIEMLREFGPKLRLEEIAANDAITEALHAHDRTSRLYSKLKFVVQFFSESFSLFGAVVVLNTLATADKEPEIISSHDRATQSSVPRPALTKPPPKFEQMQSTQLPPAQAPTAVESIPQSTRLTASVIQSESALRRAVTDMASAKHIGLASVQLGVESGLALCLCAVDDSGSRVFVVDCNDTLPLSVVAAHLRLLLTNPSILKITCNFEPCFQYKVSPLADVRVAHNRAVGRRVNDLASLLLAYWGEAGEKWARIVSAGAPFNRPWSQRAVAYCSALVVPLPALLHHISAAASRRFESDVISESMAS